MNIFQLWRDDMLIGRFENLEQTKRAAKRDSDDGYERTYHIRTRIGGLLFTGQHDGRKIRWWKR